MKKIVSFVMVFFVMLSTVTFMPKAAENEDFIAEVLALTNAERAAYGLQPLKADPVLQEAAMGRANEITSYFSHTRPNGQSCFTIIDWKSEGFTAVAENIGCGQQTPEEIVEGWMNSAGHRANILNASYTHLGVGYVYKSGDTYRHYWSQFFGKSNSNRNTVTTQPVVTQKKVTTTQPVITRKPVVTQEKVTTTQPVQQKTVTTQEKVTTTQPVITRKPVTTQEKITTTQPVQQKTVTTQKTVTNYNPFDFLKASDCNSLQEMLTAMLKQYGYLK
jgi:hypothetical protein